MATELAVCELDSVPTRLRCAGCGIPICPACQVRTAVGFKCRRCVGVPAPGSRRRGPARLLVAGAAVLAAAVALLALRPHPGASVDPLGAEAAAVAGPPTAQVMIGEEARDGQLAFVVDDFGCTLKPAPEGAARPTVGKLCTLVLTVRNFSDSPAVFLGRFQYLIDGALRSYGADEALSRDRPENASRSLSEMTINPDIVVPMVLLFDVPDSVDPVEAQFKGTGRSRFGVNVRLDRR